VTSQAGFLIDRNIAARARCQHTKPAWRWIKRFHVHPKEAIVIEKQIPVVPDAREQVSPAEWQTRVDLAAAYRLVALFGWDDLVFTHISARVPGPEHHFLINPYGMMFEEITASSLVKVDIHGNVVMDTPFPINPAGFTIHSAIHAAREDAKCVLHVHSINGIAVSAQKNGVLPISQQSIFVLASLGYHDYEGVALNQDEKPRLTRDLGDNTFFMLRNHGLLTVGESVADAFVSMYLFEAACMIQVRAQTGGGELITIDPRIIAGAKAQAQQVTRGMGAGALAWPGLLRRLDRKDASYRD
jgi:ribulose-5-phosphate 4-epimerase/fuculose-1-phosphate aldolase